MNACELIEHLQKQVDKGFGSKPVYVEDAQEMRDIHSVQMNTNSGIEPEYLFIMAGDWVYP